MTRRGLVTFGLGRGRKLTLGVFPFYWLFGRWEGAFTSARGAGPLFYLQSFKGGARDRAR